MAGNIKGITIEIDGNTKKLNSALKSVNQDLKDTQYKLRDVEKGLKFKPGNTELLNQKFKLLGDSVNEAKNKLKLLEDAEKQAAEQLKNGDIGQADYDALKLKIEAAKNEVQRLQKAYDDFGSVSAQKLAAAGQQVEKFGGNLAKVGDALTVGVTTPLLAIGTAGVAAWKELDAAMDTVTTKTGETGDNLADMQERVKSIAETIPTDFQTAADAVGEVNTRFELQGDELEDLSTKFIKFAEINNSDVATSVDNVQQVMAAWGVSTEDAGLLLDTLTKAGQDTGVSVDTLSGLLATNKTALDEMGFSVSDSAVFLANLEKNGVDASSTLTGLKKALANAAKEGKTSKEALSDLQDTITNSTDKTTAYQKAIELFGAKAGPAIADAVMDGRLSFEELGTTLEDFGGATEETFNATLDPIDELQVAMNTAKDVGAELGGTVLEILNPAMKKLSDTLKRAKAGWDKLNPKTQDAIIKFGLVAAAIGPVLSVGGRAIKGIGSIIKLVPKMGRLVSLLASPFGIAVAAIGACIAIGILLYKNWDTIKKKAEELGKKISDTWNNIKTWTVNTWNAIKTSISAAWDGIKTAVSTKIEGLKLSISTAWDNIITTASTKWNAVKTAISTAWDGIKNAVTTKVEGIKTGLSTAWDNIKTTASSKLSAIKTAISKPFEQARQAVQTAVNKIKGMFPLSIGRIFSNIKLPHISVSGGVAPYGIAGKGSLPKFHVSWYKRGYQNAVMFQDPTILGTPYGYKGFGDGNGSEMVVGTDYLMKTIQQASGANEIDARLARLESLVASGFEMVQGKTFILNGADFVYANRGNINAALGDAIRATANGVI